MRLSPRRAAPGWAPTAPGWPQVRGSAAGQSRGRSRPTQGRQKREKSRCGTAQALPGRAGRRAARGRVGVGEWLRARLSSQAPERTRCSPEIREPRAQEAVRSRNEKFGLQAGMCASALCPPGCRAHPSPRAGPLHQAPGRRLAFLLLFCLFVFFFPSLPFSVSSFFLLPFFFPAPLLSLLPPFSLSVPLPHHLFVFFLIIRVEDESVCLQSTLSHRSTIASLGLCGDRVVESPNAPFSNQE